MLLYKVNELTVSEYLELRKQVSWPELSNEQAQKALTNSLYVLAAYEDDKVVGMGRLVGDGAVICYVQDLIVIPDAQGSGIGGAILTQLKEYVNTLRMQGTRMMLCLMCAKGREAFYGHHGFIVRPNENLGPGMIQYMSEESL